MSSERFDPGVVVGGDFRIVRPLSEGGMGEVFVAEQISTGAMRALKTMHVRLASDPKLRKRFEQEARVGTRIESDHVVAVIGAGIDDKLGMPWLAMELLEGEDLAERVAREGRLPREDAAEIFAQLGHAMIAAHAVGVVHRDLKPENVFLAKPRRLGDRHNVKVLDFGIAKLLADVPVVSIGTAAVGTPLWMAPEQASKGGHVTPAADVWSLGLVAFHALTGAYYWRAANAEDATLTVLMKEITLDPLDTATARAAELGASTAISERFDEWFVRCVDRDPERRWSTREAFDGLLAILRDPTPPARVPPPRAASLTATDASSASAFDAPSPTPARAPAPPPPARTPSTTHVDAAMTPPPVSPPPPRRWLTALVALAAAGAVAAPIGYWASHRSSSSAAPSSSSAAIPAPSTLRAPAEVVALSPMKAIGGGTATIGARSDDAAAAEDEKPQHKQTVKSFMIDVTQVTVEAYARCVAAGACTRSGDDATCNANIAGREKHPVNCVTAKQAEAYCAWLGRRLPEEYEWEVVAAGLEGRRFPWGNEPPDPTRACFGKCDATPQTCPVGSFPKGGTPDGVDDMAGNVWEWTSTPYCPYTNLACDAGDKRVVRGGGWCGGDPSTLRSTARHWLVAGETNSVSTGFRCARTL